jgi:exodeoxyribonuclease V alpha subunit
MSESTGFPANTIHRLLEFRPYGEQMAHKNANDPIEADLLVVDETSMVDIELFDILLEALKTGTTLLLVGDPEQLEAVGPGAVLYDLMHTDNAVVQKAHLTEVFRQKGDSPIRINAKKCKIGDSILVQNPDFEIVRTNSPEQSLAVVRDMARYLYDPDDPFGAQILSPARKGISGVDNMNIELQQLLNPKAKYAREIVYGKNRYHLNDKIIMHKNNYDLGYCNGDCGIVTAVDSGSMTVDICGTKHTISRMLMDDVKPAYAMTIHKSQGSDFPSVVAVFPKEPSIMLTRNLFYTAITRAKKRVYVVTEGDAMEIAIATTRHGVRQTGLQPLIREEAVKAGLLAA